MLRYGLRAFHITLVAACLYLLYGVVSAFLGTTELAEPSIPDVEALPRSEVDFLPYQIVGERNLFESRDVALPPPPPPEEKLQESKLQLRLIGTIAGTSRALSWATVENEKTKEHLHVTIGDQLGATPDIKVARIERKKLVVDNKGQFEAITMDEPETTTKPRSPKTRPNVRRRPSTKPATSSRSSSQRERLLKRVRRLTNDSRRTRQPRQAHQAAEALDEEARSEVKSLLEQVRFAPSVSDHGTGDGIKITEVLPGTPLEDSGLQSGDVIVMVNGVEINGPKDLSKIPPTPGRGEESCLKVVSPDGRRKTHCWGD